MQQSSEEIYKKLYFAPLPEYSVCLHWHYCQVMPGKVLYIKEDNITETERFCHSKWDQGLPPVAGLDKSGEVGTNALDHNHGRPFNIYTPCIKMC